MGELTARDLYALNMMLSIEKVVREAIAGLSDQALAIRLGVSEWHARLLRQRSLDWTLNDVSDLLLAVGAELEMQMDRPTPPEEG